MTDKHRLSLPLWVVLCMAVIWFFAMWLDSRLSRSQRTPDFDINEAMRTAPERVVGWVKRDAQPITCTRCGHVNAYHTVVFHTNKTDLHGEAIHAND